MSGSPGIDIPTARDQHYQFAHRTLPKLVFENPATVFAAIVEHNAEPLRALWRWIGERLEPSTARIEPEGLAGQVLSLDDIAIVALITLPPPQGLAEAYFVAAVYLHRPGEPPETATVHYFTLELTSSFSTPPIQGPGATMLCSWTAEGAHVNHGMGPAPTPEGFIQAVRALLGAPPYDGPPVGGVRPALSE